MERSLNILLVDDEEIIHQTIGSYLIESGHKVEGVYDGRSALKAIEAQEYDLALIDMRMPGMNGLSLLARFKELRPIMPVIIVAGHGDIDVVSEVLRLGASEFMRKPIGLIDLETVLEEIFSD